MTYDFITLLFSKEKYFIKALKFEEKKINTKLFNWRRFIPFIARRPWPSSLLNANKSRVVLLHELLVLHIPIVNLIFLHTYYNKIHTSVLECVAHLIVCCLNQIQAYHWLFIDNCNTGILQWFRSTIFFLNFNYHKFQKIVLSFALCFILKYIFVKTTTFQSYFFYLLNIYYGIILK